MKIRLEHHRICDVNEIRCTHNTDTNVDIWLREQQAILYLMAQINCESQLQANEVTHQIKTFLSPGKYIQLFPFSSFQQIPDHFFNRKFNDPEKHNIENLYMKYNPEVGSTQYFFKINYKPIFRFNSVNAEISDNSARSYPVTCDISYLIQLPMWLFDTWNDPQILRINLGMVSNDNISSIVADNNFLSFNDSLFELNGIKYQIGSQYIIDPTSSNFQNNKIIIPKPDKLFLLQIAKLSPRKSTVVSWAGSHRSLPTNITKENLRYWLGSKELVSKYLTENDYVVKKNTQTGTEEIILFTEGNPDLTPDLDSPIITSFLFPVSAEEEKKIITTKKKFSNVYEIREQKTWRKRR